MFGFRPNPTSDETQKDKEKDEKEEKEREKGTPRQNMVTKEKRTKPAEPGPERNPNLELWKVPKFGFSPSFVSTETKTKNSEGREETP